MAASGGSTNAVLRLLAIAPELDIFFSIEEFDGISRPIPVIADLKPGGRSMAPDLFGAGGVAVLIRELVNAGLVDADAATVNGRTLGEIGRDAAEPEGQEGIVLVANLLKPRVGIAVPTGNLAPQGCVGQTLGRRPLGAPRTRPRV